MNLKHLPVIALVSLALSAGLICGLAAQASGPSEVLPQDRGRPEEQACLQQYGGSPLNLQDCQQYCRSTYGVDPYSFWGRRGWGSWYHTGYAICIQECNQRYWDAWDEWMDKSTK